MFEERSGVMFPPHNSAQEPGAGASHNTRRRQRNTQRTQAKRTGNTYRDERRMAEVKKKERETGEYIESITYLRCKISF